MLKIKVSLYYLFYVGLRDLWQQETTPQICVLDYVSNQMHYGGIWEYIVDAYGRE